LLEQLINIDGLELSEGLDDVLFDIVNGVMMASVSAAERLRDDGVDQAESFEVLAGEFEGFGGQWCLRAVSPEDSSTTFR